MTEETPPAPLLRPEVELPVLVALGYGVVRVVRPVEEDGAREVEEFPGTTGVDVTEETGGEGVTTIVTTDVTIEFGLYVISVVIVEP